MLKQFATTLCLWEGVTQRFGLAWIWATLFHDCFSWLFFTPLVLVFYWLNKVSRNDLPSPLITLPSCFLWKSHFWTWPLLVWDAGDGKLFLVPLPWNMPPPGTREANLSQMLLPVLSYLIPQPSWEEGSLVLLHRRENWGWRAYVTEQDSCTACLVWKAATLFTQSAWRQEDSIGKYPEVCPHAPWVGGGPPPLGLFAQ